MIFKPYDVNAIIRAVSWAVEIGDEFEPEFDVLHEDLLQQFGPPSRPVPRGHAERLESREHEGAAVQRGGRRVRVALAFDPKRKAILLVAGDKSGGSGKRFYRELIRKAAERFDAHLARQKSERNRPWL
jgi:hypothetical protein